MRQQLAQKDDIFSIYLFAFLIPLNPKWYGVGLILIALESILKRKFITAIPWRRAYHMRNPLVWLICFYLLHIVGLWNSENMSFAWLDIGMKIPLLLIPLYFLHFKLNLKPSKVWAFFVYGCLLSLLIYGTSSFIQFIQTGKLNTGVYFSYWMHRGYYATYLVVACTYLFIEILRNKRRVLIRTLVLLVFIAGIFFTEAKLGLLTLFINVFILALHAAKQKFGWLKFGLSLVLIALVSIFVVSKVLDGHNRFSGAAYHLQNQKNLDITSIESTTARLLLWETSLELINQKPLIGYGTGDIKDVLQARNYAKGYSGVAEAKYNAHNQFLNSWIALGVLGASSLFALFIAIFSMQTTVNSIFVKLSSVAFLLMFMTESFLETQAGIIPFAFIVSLFSSYSKFNSDNMEVS